MPEEDLEQRGVLFRPFILLSVVVAVTAVFGLFYLLGLVILSHSSVKEVAQPAPNPPQKIWVSKRLTICSEVWQKRQIGLEKYLGSLGVEIFDRISSSDTQSKDKVSCLKCSCLSGETLYLQVYKEALSDLVGFVESGPPQKND